jgi:hypothetical protein
MPSVVLTALLAISGDAIDRRFREHERVIPASAGISWMLVGVVIHERPASSREALRKHIDADWREQTKETHQYQQ